MKAIAITQRVTVVPKYGERRDCLDQAWIRFLEACELVPIIVPNIPNAAISLCNSVSLVGYVLTGGNDLISVGGDAPERDATENALLDLADCRKQPVLGVCRGMQVIQSRYSVPLQRVEGHVASQQTISVEGRLTEVNSYHRFGTTQSFPPLEVWAVADDGVVKAVRHSNRLFTGIMWHPERFVPYRPADIALFRRVFGVA